MLKKKSIIATDENELDEFQCLRYIDDYFSYNVFSVSSKVIEFCEIYKDTLSVETLKNSSFNFFCSYIIRTRDVSDDEKKSIRKLKAFEMRRIREWKQHCRNLFEFIVQNEVIINDKLLFLLYNETMDNNLINKYILYLIYSENRILNYIKYDANIGAHINLYCEEFFSTYIWLKTNEFPKYKYIERYITKEEKIRRIDQVIKSDRVDVLYVTKFNNVICGLKCIKEIETNHDVKIYIDNAIKKLIDERAKTVQSDAYKERLETIESPIEIPNEYFELMKIIDDDFRQFTLFLHTPDFFSMSKPNIASLVNYNVFDSNTGFVKNEVTNTEFIKYINNHTSEVSMSSLQLYGNLIQMGTEMFVYGASKYADFSKFKKSLTIEIQNIFSYNFSEDFIFSMAGATFLASIIEVVLKNTHDKRFSSRETSFEMIKDLHEKDYITKNELFYIMYVLYDENGLNLRNNLCHGNFRFDTDESNYCYILFKIFIMIATAIERKEH
ncbi:DUF4209 domain-containing protein [Mollicutes bacterium LVI A0078]|nr:DUF4209 domain-containing protein [Mollicutes bacterium LVI A0075]WOO91176.1 DUF4209 domain-containing protein [Mollicutes bacterium LVI A0078]